MKFLSLFSGIGGLDLGLERAGMRCVGQVEIDPFCRQVLAMHWPDVPRWEDVRTLKAKDLNERPDLICGGFPCQDISNAGRRAGIRGERSGLWAEFHRLICEIRPGWVFVENVAALIIRGLNVVLGDLAEVGYDAEWHCIPASAVGAPHIRDRIWIVAYPATNGRDKKCAFTEQQHSTTGCGGDCEPLQMANGAIPGEVAYPSAFGRQVAGYGEHDGKAGGAGEAVIASRKTSDVSNAKRTRLERAWLRRAIADSPEWLPEPGVCRVVNGVSGGMDRLAALGNAVVPQVAEVIGRAIMQADNIQ